MLLQHSEQPHSMAQLSSPWESDCERMRTKISFDWPLIYTVLCRLPFFYIN